MSQSARLVFAVVGTGVIAGAVGAFMVLFLHLVQWLAFGHDNLLLLDALRQTPTWRRFVAVPLGASLAAAIWWSLRRRRPVTGVATALGTPDADFPVFRTTADALLQVLVVGSGTSVGRENAPRQMAAALANAMCRFLGLEWKWRRLLIGSGAGAALAAVYNTPLAAIPFSLAIVLREWSWSGALLSAVVSAIAVPISWLVTEGLPATPLVVEAPTSSVGLSVYLWAVVAIPLCAGVGWLFKSVCRAAQKKARIVAPTWLSLFSMMGVGVLTGAVGLLFSQILGNGKSTLDVIFGNVAPIEPVMFGVMLAVFLLKPSLTALSLRTGIAGGLLMPSLATGAAMGATVALALVHVDAVSTAVVGIFAIIAAAGILSVTQASPIFATIFAVELTHSAAWIWPAIALATAGSHGLVKLVERYRKR